jgi:hypothetical protein
MAKATGKSSEKKRTVICGACKGEGHNSRTCPGKNPSVTEEPVKVVEPKKIEPKKVVAPRRDAPTADMGTAATAAPHRCNKCNSVAILVIVRVKDHNESFKRKKEVFKGEMRCEQCMNKPTPSDLILVWGAEPDQVAEIKDA